MTRNPVEKHRHKVTKTQRNNAEGFCSLCLCVFVASEGLSNQVTKNNCMKILNFREIDNRKASRGRL